VILLEDDIVDWDEEYPPTTGEEYSQSKLSETKKLLSRDELISKESALKRFPSFDEFFP
jgi:hypothetical protein